MEQSMKKQPEPDRKTFREHLTDCTVCGSEEMIKKDPIPDFSVTGESFEINTCAQCGFMFVNPRPKEQDIARYYDSENYVSHSQTRKGLINRLYGWLQNSNIKYKYRLLPKDVPRGTWMDYGSGAGSFIAYATKKGNKTLGLEPNREARLASISKNLDVRTPDALYDLDDHCMACITMWHVLEHVHKLRPLASGVFRIAMPGAVLAVAVPNRLSYDAHYYGKYWAAWDVPRHLWHFREMDVRRIFEKEGFEYHGKKPLWLDSFYVSMLSEKYRKGHVLRGALIGLLSNFYARFSGYPYSSQVYLFKKPI